MSMDTIRGVSAKASCVGFGMKFWIQGTHRSSKTLMEAPSLIR